MIVVSAIPDASARPYRLPGQQRIAAALASVEMERVQ